MLLEDRIATLNNTLDAVENNLISKEPMSKYLYPILEILTNINSSWIEKYCCHINLKYLNREAWLFSSWSYT